MGTPVRNAAYELCEQNHELIEGMLQAGDSQRAVAEMLGISRGMLGWWLTKTENGRALYARAREAAAHALADENRELTTGLLRRPMIDPETGEIIPGRYREPTTNEIAAVRAIADNNKWTAARWNRALYGEQNSAAAINVQVNVGAAALDSLRKTQVVDMGQADIVEAPAPARIEDLL